MAPFNPSLTRLLAHLCLQPPCHAGIGLCSCPCNSIHGFLMTQAFTHSRPCPFSASKTLIRRAAEAHERQREQCPCSALSQWQCSRGCGSVPPMLSAQWAWPYVFNDVNGIMQLLTKACPVPLCSVLSQWQRFSWLSIFCPCTCLHPGGHVALTAPAAPSDLQTLFTWTWGARLLPPCLCGSFQHTNE